MGEVGHSYGELQTSLIKKTFVLALFEQATVHHARVEAGLSDETLYRWRAEDKDFARAWDYALEHGIESASDQVEGAFWKRAVHGVNRGVYYKGERVGTEVEYDTTAGIFYLKGARPWKYADRQAVAFDGKITVEYLSDWRQDAPALDVEAEP